MFIKDPDALLDYVIDWSDWLSGDTIADSEWIVPDGLVNVDDSFTDAATTIWLSGGTAGRKYSLTNRITTAGGRVDDRSIGVMVRNR